MSQQTMPEEERKPGRFRGIVMLLRSRIADNPYWRSILTLMSGTVGGQVIGMASMLVLARIYTPADFGGFAFFMAATGLLAILATGKYEHAVFVAKTRREGMDLAQLTLVLAIGIGSVLVLLALVLNVMVVGGDSFAMQRSLLPLIALGTITSGAFAGYNAFAIQQERFSLVARNRIIQALIGATLGIGLGILGWGAPGLAIGFLAGQSVAAVLLFRAAGRADTHSHATRRALLVRARRHIRFPRYLLIGELFNHLGNNLIAFVTPTLFGAAALGQYNFGQRIAGMPITMIGGAMGDVFRSAISPQTARPEEVVELFHAHAWRLAKVAALVTVPLVLAAPQLLSLVFGEQWREAGLYLQILSPLIFVRFVTSPLSATISLAGWQKLDTLLQILFVITAVLALTAGWWMQSFLVAVIAIGGLHFAVYALYFIVSHLAAKAVSHHGEK